MCQNSGTESQKMPTLDDCYWHLQTMDYNDKYWIVMMSNLEYPTLFTTNESHEKPKSFIPTLDTTHIPYGICLSIHAI